MKYFGTDGIRGAATIFTKDFLGSIVAGLADYAGTDKSVLIGGDTRESTEWILQDLSTALESLGFEYASVGVLPTPAINYCFYQMGFDFAIDVTASHNPYTDNGIKIFERGATSGVKLGEKGCEAIEAAIIAQKKCPEIATSDRMDLSDEAIAIYREHLLDYLEGTDLSGLHIGMDCANGATSVIGKQVFETLGATVELIHADASFGQSINMNCGSTHPESLRELVTSKNLDFGVAYDGDGDRTILIDHTGLEIDGDDTLAILANFLNLDQIAVTVMSNQGLLNWAKSHNVKTEITSVGDSNVAAAMRELDIKIGGEQSGHIILPGESTGDGMLTSLMLAKVVSTTGTPLHDLRLEKLPQITVNLTATPEQKSALKTKDTAKNLLLDYGKALESTGGRLLVRPSGTENLIRITLWGTDESVIRDLAEELKTKLGETL